MTTVTRSASVPPPLAVAVTGSATIAVSFGFARYGYGLFVPSFRSTFGLSTSAVGVIGSLGYAAYLLGLLSSGWTTGRYGPRLPVLIGCASAAGGSAIIATASGPVSLGVGAALAGSSPGWAWAPFADAVVQLVRAPLRRRVLSVISTGTTFGLVVAGPLALASGGGGGWRLTWGSFAVLAVLVGAADRVVLPASAPLRATGSRQPLWSQPASLRVLRTLRQRPAELRLLGQAAAYGSIAAVYFTYAVDLVTDAGLGDAWSALLWTFLGLGGVSGVATGDAVTRLGLRRTFGVCLLLLAVGIGLLAVAPAVVLVAGGAAALFGFAYMPMAALLALWSAELHADAPTAGFTRVLAAMASGSVLGPLLFGPLSDQLGMRAVFGCTAGVALLALGLRPRPSVAPAVR